MLPYGIVQFKGNHEYRLLLMEKHDTNGEGSSLLTFWTAGSQAGWEACLRQSLATQWPSLFHHSLVAS